MQPPERVLVGLSGGLDSILLTHVLHGSGFDVHAIHVNYGIRRAADGEEAFVRTWCQRRGIPLHVERAGPCPPSGVQTWARDLRYQVMADEAHASDIGFVAVGHHADDQLETLLIHLERGTGLAGLVGMRPMRPLDREGPVTLVRPMLALSRSELEEAALAEGLEWVEDGSNADPTYRRNDIRGELSALDAARLSALRVAALALTERMEGMAAVIRNGILAIIEESGMRLPFSEVDGWPTLVQRWIVLEWLDAVAPGLPRRQSIADDILALRRAQPGRRFAHGSTTIWRERDAWVCDAPLLDTRTAGIRKFESTEESGHAEPLTVHRFDLPDGGLEDKLAAVREHGRSLGWDGFEVVDAEQVGGSLSSRLWQEGDRFQPLGMTGTRKVKAYLTDRKVSSASKRRIRVVTDGTSVVWVVGHQIDARYRITSSSREAYLLWMDPAQKS